MEDKKVELIEVPDGTSLTLRTHSKLDTLEFETTLSAHSSGFVLLDAIIKTEDNIEAVMDIDTNFSYCDILWDNNGKVVCFRPRVIRTLSMGDGEVYYVISGNVKGEEKNRRSTPRFDFVRRGVSVINDTQTMENVQVHDISLTGFSIVTDGKAELGSKVKLAFMTEDKKPLVLSGTIVRIIDGEEEYLYGCQMEKDNPELTKLIMEIQREILLKHKNTRKT